jgi:hypothetical protein
MMLVPELYTDKTGKINIEKGVTSYLFTYHVFLHTYGIDAYFCPNEYE